MAYKITDIQGIGAVYSARLLQAGIDTPEALLAKAATRRQRSELAARTGISGTLLLTWTNHADLFRVRGIGPQYAELLELAGVDTIKELGHRIPSNLAIRMREVNERRRLVRGAISERAVARWIEEAKALPPIMKY